LIFLLKNDITAIYLCGVTWEFNVEFRCWSAETSHPLLSPPLPRTARTRILPCFGTKNAGF
jgi:hypothetical protein